MFSLTFLTSAAQILWKFGVDKMTWDLFSLVTNWQIILGILLYLVAGVFMIVSFRGGEVSALYPIVATSYIWVSFLSIYFLNEIMSMFKWIGVSIIFLGIVLIGYGSNRQKVSEKVIRAEGEFIPN